MKFKQVGISARNGTSLQGYVTETFRTLAETFGSPESLGVEDKITVEWAIQFEDGTVATIYDWKRYELGAPGLDEVYEWHIGGHTLSAVDRVVTALEDESFRLAKTPF